MRLVRFDTAGAQDLPHPFFGVARALLQLDWPGSVVCGFNHRLVEDCAGGVCAFPGRFDAAFGGLLGCAYA